MPGKALDHSCPLSIRQFSSPFYRVAYAQLLRPYLVSLIRPATSIQHLINGKHIIFPQKKEKGFQY